MIIAKIHVSLKASVFDPQGETVNKSLRSMGFDEVEGVRVGKLIEVTLKTNDKTIAEVRVRDMCEKLLTNAVIEKYSFELTEVAG